MGNSKSRHKEYSRSKLVKEGVIRKTSKFLETDIESVLKTRYFKLTDREISYYGYYSDAAGELKNRAVIDSNFRLLAEDKLNNEGLF
jgi:hypothetical protein